MFWPYQNPHFHFVVIAVTFSYTLICNTSKHFLLSAGGSDESRKSEKDSTKFGKCTWCKKFGSLNDYSSNLQGREIYCTGLCSKNCFEQAALKILNVEAGYGLETSIYSDNFPIRTSLENLSRHQQQDARDRYKDGRPYDQPAHEGVRSRFDVSRLQAGIAKGSDVVRPNPIIASPPASLPTSGAIRVPMWNIENVRSMRSGEPMSSTKQGMEFRMAMSRLISSLNNFFFPCPLGIESKKTTNTLSIISLIALPSPLSNSPVTSSLQFRNVELLAQAYSFQNYCYCFHNIQAF